LDLCDCRITDTGLSRLVDLTRLEYLDVSNTGVKGWALDSIIKRNPNLKIINLGATSITEEIVERLKRAHPQVVFVPFY
jgi:hypothetical protein